MAPWWAALDLQSVAHLRQRVPGIPRIYFEYIFCASIVWPVLECIISLVNLSMVSSIATTPESMLAFATCLLPQVSVATAIVLSTPEKQESLLLSVLLFQTLHLALAIACWAVLANDAAGRGVGRSFNGRIFALAFLPALVGLLVASFLYWNMFVARDPFGNVNFSGGEVPDLMPYTDEAAYPDEDGPLARLYALQRSRPQPSVRPTEVSRGSLLGGNGSSSETQTKSTQHDNEPSSSTAGGDTGTSVSDDNKKPKDTDRNTRPTDHFERLLGRRARSRKASGLPGMPRHVHAGGEAFNEVVVFILFGMVVQSVSIWAAVEAGLSGRRIGWMNIALLSPPLLTVPAVLWIPICHRNPSPENLKLRIATTGMSLLGWILSTCLSVILMAELRPLGSCGPNERSQECVTMGHVLSLAVLSSCSLLVSLCLLIYFLLTVRRIWPNVYIAARMALSSLWGQES
ncbi:hypothetical protein ACJZ2D_000644 [Fusarium nematophilum]